MSDEILQGPPRADRPEFSFQTRMDGQQYRLRFAYNTRIQQWYLDLQGPDGEVIFNGVRVTTGQNLLRPFVGANVPPGQLFVRDESGAGRDPDRFGFRGQFRVIYRPAADVAAAAGTDAEVP